MKLFTKEIDQKLFDQYMMGNDLENQMVVAKIFNPYGNGVWYLLNSDPSDPDYLWAIVDLFEVEVGSVSREELETLKVPPFRLGLERDLYFTPMNAKKLYESLLKGEKFEDGGTIDIKKDQNGDNWVFPNNPQGETYGIKLAAGGMTAGRWYKDNSGQELRYIGESKGKLLFNDGEKIVYKDESDFQEAPKEKKLFGLFEKGGTIKVGSKIKYQGKEGKIVSKKGDMYFVEVENYYPNGDTLRSVLRDGEFEKMAHGGETKGKRYTVNVYYGGEMEDEELYTDSLEEAQKLSQGGEHSEIYDNHKKEFVEIEYAKGGMMEHGLRIGDKITTDMFWDNKIVVENQKTHKRAEIDLENGKRKDEMARGGGIEFTPYGETKGIYKVYYKADGKPQTEIWETKEMAVNTAKRYSSPQMQDEFSNVKVFDEDGSEVDYMSEAKYDEGGETEDEGIDLFEDYDDIPENVQKVLDKHSDAFENEDYKGLEKAKKELEKIGYTFEYGLDGEAYDLRKIGQKGKNDDEYAKGGELMKHKHLEYVTIELIEPTSKGWKVKQIETHSVRGRKLSTPKEKVAYFSKEEIKDLFEPMMAKGGRTKFKDKVQSIKASLLKRKKVSPKVQKDYGKTYSPKEAEESAKRIVGSMVKKEKRQPRVSKMLEKMKKGTQLKKKKSTFNDRMKDLSTKIKERKSKSTK